MKKSWVIVGLAIGLFFSSQLASVESQAGTSSVQAVFPFPQEIDNQDLRWSFKLGELVIKTDQGFAKWQQMIADPNTGNVITTALEKAVIGKNVTQVPDSAFISCTNLRALTFETGTGAKALTIGKSAFQTCTLGDLVIPERVVAIDNYAFSITGIRKLKFEGQPRLAEYAFTSCPLLEEVDFGAITTLPPGIFFINSPRLEKVIANQVTDFGNYAILSSNLRYIEMARDKKISIDLNQTYQQAEIFIKNPQQIGLKFDDLRAADFQSSDPSGKFELDAQSGYVIYTLGTQKAVTITEKNAPFTPVKDITGVPSQLRVGEKVTLNGLITPNDATKQMITWQLADNQAEATLQNNQVTAKKMGTLQLVATVKNGATPLADFTKTFTLKVVDDAATFPLYRLYNPNSSEHLYTVNGTEKDQLVSLGWQDEGVIGQAPFESGAEVYRVYNPNAGDHHYTQQASERDHLVSVGWQDEGVAFRSGGPTDILRLYNPNAVAGSHHYTPAAAERDQLVSLGWQAEGIGWQLY
ncbi:leucine-rich repeat protein [Enterococcus sp. CSURQ0835]|uniref:leucine-rich repeat protein n=1 Tax=Enterococcus sp. CSURQ0835 TaxID=2681394 RepID=UPI00135BE601|nr:leucine-rich repeat protein [Enterococcus sp. CSURQ0835]